MCWTGDAEIFEEDCDCDDSESDTIDIYIVPMKESCFNELFEKSGNDLDDECGLLMFCIVKE